MTKERLRSNRPTPNALKKQAAICEKEIAKFEALCKRWSKCEERAKKFRKELWTFAVDAELIEGPIPKQILEV